MLNCFWKMFYFILRKCLLERGVMISNSCLWSLYQGREAVLQRADSEQDHGLYNQDM